MPVLYFTRPREITLGTTIHYLTFLLGHASMALHCAQYNNAVAHQLTTSRFLISLPEVAIMNTTVQSPSEKHVPSGDKAFYTELSVMTAVSWAIAAIAIL